MGFPGMARYRKTLFSPDLLRCFCAERDKFVLRFHLHIPPHLVHISSPSAATWGIWAMDGYYCHSFNLRMTAPLVGSPESVSLISAYPETEEFCAWWQKVQCYSNQSKTRTCTRSWILLMNMRVIDKNSRLHGSESSRPRRSGTSISRCGSTSTRSPTVAKASRSAHRSRHLQTPAPQADSCHPQLRQDDQKGSDDQSSQTTSQCTQQNLQQGELLPNFLWRKKISADVGIQLGIRALDSFARFEFPPTWCNFHSRRNRRLTLCFYWWRLQSTSTMPSS